MQLATSQNFSLRQSLVVTAQLQQAICLLQMGNTDLQSFIASQAEENPFIDLGLPPQPSAKGALPAPSHGMDAYTGSGKGKSGDDWDRIASLVAEPGLSLFAHATAEILRLRLTAAENALAVCFLDALEPSGWLGQPLEMIALRGGVAVEQAEALLRRLHRIEPAGLFARTLAECLRLQAIDQGILTPLFSAVLDNLPMLAAADLRGLARVCGCPLEELKSVLHRLRALNPKPGGQFDTAIIPQRPPDLIVTRGAAGWMVDLNRSTLPTVIVRHDEAETISTARAETGAYVSERLSLAKWLARAVAHRNQTTLKVGVEVVRRQSAFLEQGAAQMRPMILRDVAAAIGVHESTVSRVTSGLMIATPQGTFPLKVFFNAALVAREGDQPGSASAVRHRIRQLVATESPQDPLSDDAIVRIISGEGVNLARRTVAKYRDLLMIPSSVQRRRQAVMAG